MTHKTYKIYKAQLKVETTTFFHLNYFKYVLKSILRYLFKAVIFIASFALTLLVYLTYIEEIKPSETITVGALLSALGTSIISISSLLCNENRERFNKNTEMLIREQTDFKAQWEHRPFLKRISRHKRGKFYEYCILQNPIIDFNGLNWSKKIDVPTSISDFYELPVLYNYLKLIFCRRNYRNLIQANFEGFSEEIFLWDNLTDTYKRIIIYKCFSLTSFIGFSIVINSLIFSFFYHLAASYIDFQNIILTIFAGGT